MERAVQIPARLQINVQGYLIWIKQKQSRRKAPHLNPNEGPDLGTGAGHLSLSPLQAAGAVPSAGRGHIRGVLRHEGRDLHRHRRAPGGDPQAHGPRPPVCFRIFVPPLFGSWRKKTRQGLGLLRVCALVFGDCSFS